MNSSVSLEDRIWFLRVCHHVPFALYSDFLQIRSVGAELFDTDGRTDGQTDRHTGRRDEANSRFSQFTNAPKKCEESEMKISVTKASLTVSNERNENWR